MGKQSDGLKPFTIDDLYNRKLMLEMLRKEDELFMSKLGQEHLTQHGGLTSLEGNKVLQRDILNRFGYLADDDSLRLYRSVIHVYYKSPQEYDREIMNSVVYLRENRLLYYDTMKPRIGQKYVDVDLLTLDGTETVKLSSLMPPKPKTKLLVASFSTS